MFFLTPGERLSMYPELLPTRDDSRPWTSPSIALWRFAAPGDMISSSTSLSSEMSGTVGRERPAAIGAWVNGVFWGVGAVIFDWEMGTLADMVVEESQKRVVRSFGIDRGIFFFSLV